MTKDKMLQLLDEIPFDAICFVEENHYEVSPHIPSGKEWIAWFIEMVGELDGGGQLEMDFVDAVTVYFQFSEESLNQYKETTKKLGIKPSDDDFMGLAMAQQSELEILRRVVQGIGTIIENYKSMKQEKARQ